MHVLANYIGAQRTLDGDLTVTFAIDAEEDEVAKLDEIKDKLMVLDVKKYSEKRSLNANKYFWQLCDKIAEKLNSDKISIYLMQLKHDGVFVDLEVRNEALDEIRKQFRYVEEYDDGLDYTFARCYIGSSHYSTAQMSRLINGTVEEAKQLGIETLTPAEIARLIEKWEAK